MKKIILSLALCWSAATGFSQNLIANGNFETLSATPGNGNDVALATGWSGGCATLSTGALGSPDLISNYTTSSNSIPLDGRIAQQGSITTNRVFVGMLGQSASTTNPPGHGESIIGTITEPLSDQYEYTVSLWNAIWGHPSFPDEITRIEIVLRKPNDCTSAKLVYTSGILPVDNHGDIGVVSANWNLVSGTFILSAADVAQGYTRMEIRFNGWTSLRAGIDNVSLTKRKLPKADFSFVTPGQTYTTVSTPYGPEQLTQVCAAAIGETAVLINGGASTDENGYGINIQAFNPSTYTGGAVMYNNWISNTGAVPSTDINISNLAGVNLQVGQIYMVTVFVGSPYSYKSKLFRVNGLPMINAGADGTFCSADGINVTTSNWPVQVLKTGGINLGTFNANPIMLPAAASSTYTFITTNAFGCGAQDNAVLTMKQCSRASFVFKNPAGTQIVSTPYGPEQLTLMCAPYKIDGSASVYENAYHFLIREFNMQTYTNIGPVLYEGWYGTGAVGNDINLSTVIGSNSFVVGHTYLVQLTVGPDWHSKVQFFMPVACKNGAEVAPEDVTAELQDIDVFPNPTSGEFAVALGSVTAEQVTVTNTMGETIFSTVVPEDATAVNIDLRDLPAAVYMVHVRQQNGSTIVRKIVKN